MSVRIEQTWKDSLENEWNQDYFIRLTDFVRDRYRMTTVYPPAGKIFAAFDSCPFDQVKVVILGQDPYHGPGQANGLCFSVSPGIELPPSRVNIFKEVSSDLSKPMPDDGNLERWARQGVLLLNATLTVEAHKAGSHQGHGWEEFTDAAVKKLAEEREGLVFMLWGSYAIRKGAFIDRNRHLVLTAPHPSPLSAYRGFFGCKLWLVDHNQAPIVW